MDIVSPKLSPSGCIFGVCAFHSQCLKGRQWTWVNWACREAESRGVFIDRDVYLINLLYSNEHGWNISKGLCYGFPIKTLYSCRICPWNVWLPDAVLMVLSGPRTPSPMVNHHWMDMSLGFHRRFAMSFHSLNPSLSPAAFSDFMAIIISPLGISSKSWAKNLDFSAPRIVSRMCRISNVP